MTSRPQPPGERLARELESRHWMQKDLAEILGRPMQLVNEVISGKKEITRETAAQLGAALGTSAELWLNMQDAYRLHLLDQDQEHLARLAAIRQRAEQTVRPAPPRLNPDDFPGFTPKQIAKLEAMARRMGRQLRDQAAE